MRPTERQQGNLDNRNRELDELTQRLPGCEPYENVRPLNIPGRFHGEQIFDVVSEWFPHIDVSQWQQWFSDGNIMQHGAAVSPDRVVHGGEQFLHRFPDAVEPSVNAGIRLLWEDDALVALDKPAPLPVHPCGRFNRNTLTYFLDKLFGPNSLRLVHRLDANTSGVMVMAKTKSAASNLRKQFEEEGVGKRYLARVNGSPNWNQFQCDQPLGRKLTETGGRGMDPAGLKAVTEFRVLQRFSDGTSLVQAEPKTGRTNQIRIHLWGIGFPVLGDPAYQADGRVYPSRTLSIDDPSMCLHASSLMLRHPMTGQAMKLEVPDPRWITSVK